MTSRCPGEAGTTNAYPSALPDVDAAFADLLVRVKAATERLDSTGAEALLRTLLGMQERFAHCVDEAARRAHHHLSWEAIGRIAGVTKQAAHHRWGRNDATTRRLAG
jgi:hypothetical protein